MYKCSRTFECSLQSVLEHCSTSKPNPCGPRFVRNGSRCAKCREQRLVIRRFVAWSVWWTRRVWGLSNRGTNAPLTGRSNTRSRVPWWCSSVGAASIALSAWLSVFWVIRRTTTGTLLVLVKLKVWCVVLGATIMRLLLVSEIVSYRAQILMTFPLNWKGIYFLTMTFIGMEFNKINLKVRKSK